MKRLYASHNTLMLEQLHAALTDAGIMTNLRNMNRTGQAAGELPPIVCWPEIWLRDPADLDAATRIRDELLGRFEAPGADWTCPACGERLEGQFGSCWQCATGKPEP